MTPVIRPVTRETAAVYRRRPLIVTIRYFLPHRACAAFLAISFLRSAGIFVMRAFPPRRPASLNVIRRLTI